MKKLIGSPPFRGGATLGYTPQYDCETAVN